MKTSLKQTLRKASCFTKRNASNITTGVGAVGVIATAVMTAKATPRFLTLLDSTEKEKDRPLTTIEKVKISIPVYMPSVVMGISTIACIIGSNILNKQIQSSLASACVLINNSYTEYRNKMNELYGSDADMNVRNALARDKLKTCNLPRSDKLLFFDEFSGRFFERTMEEVLYAEYHFNRNLALRGEATLNEFYDFLGLSHIKGGDTMGWSLYAGEAYYGYSWVDFLHIFVEADEEEPDSMDFYRISMPFAPSTDYDLIE